MSKSDPPRPKLEVKEKSSGLRVASRRFPGPSHADSALRVACERAAFADITAHAKELLDKEVCGVLVGQVCEDDEGRWVHVEAIVRGTAARQANVSVTFTQETWTKIHETIETSHRGRQIVGWYHTHPGFGVEFSEMDLFIQKNFFGDPSQIALVTDPLGGAIAICCNGASGIEYLDRFWVDGREQPARKPAAAAPAGSGAGTGSGRTAGDAGAVSPQAMQLIEARLNQVLQALDETRAYYHRILSVAALVFCAVIVGLAGYFVFRSFAERNEPPKLNTIVPVPVQIGDRTVLLGVQVVEWRIPDELNAVYRQAAHELAERLAAAAAAQAGPPPGSAPPAGTPGASAPTSNSTAPAAPRPP